MYLLAAVVLGVIGSQCTAQVVGPLKNEEDQGGKVLPFAILQCLIRPNMKVRWLFEGENVENSSMFSTRVRVTTGDIITEGAYGTTLTIQSLSYLDAGIYSCEVYNRSSAEWISAPIELVLPVQLELVKQEITTYNDSVVVKLGCDMAGYVRPDNDLHWFRGEGAISQSSKYDVEFRNGSQTAQQGGTIPVPSRLCVLKILHPEIKDTGTYTCSINGTNKTAYVELLVLEASAPSGFPQNVTAATISPTEIELSWNEVLEGERNGNITHYEIRYSQSTFSSIAGNSTILTDGPVLKLLLQNLEEFVEYTFTVRAYTVIGPGPFSPPVVNTTFEDRPATAPESLSVVSFNVSSLGVTWQRPNNIAINGILRNYVLKYCLTGDEGVPITNSCVMLQNISQDTTTKTLTGLKHYTTYSLHIAAVTIDTGPFASKTQTTGGTVLLMNPHPAMALGPENVEPATNLSCTVISEGSFIWQWSFPGGNLTSDAAGTVTFGNYALHTNSETNTSVLEVRGLKFKDGGDYQCEVRHQAWDVVLGRNNSLLQLQYSLRADTTRVMAYLHQTSVQLACNLSGFVPSSAQVKWFQENGNETQNSSKYSISMHIQHGNEEIGGVAPQLSILTVYNTLLSDSGIYTCVLLNSTAAINLVVLAPTPGYIIAITVCMAVLVVIATIAVAVYYCKQKHQAKQPQLSTAATAFTTPPPVPTEDNTAPEKFLQPLSTLDEKPLPEEVPTPNGTCTDMDIGVCLYSAQQASPLENTESSLCNADHHDPASSSTGDDSTDKDVCKLEITSSF